ncbi:hypothetical protein [uncultured Duncaniella sp.]|uniref:hypothetical protein n=1 Tax=uncultured Duncaniella sp. TaxID=2768039 RepID=UPI002611395F|nr:hypothetical protein [uncultured Duncaniella sp.]
MDKKEDRIGYLFTAVPTNFYNCCDNNVRSMLFTLVQLSSYYADSDGWFFRTNEDLRAQSKLSENLARATLSTLYKIGVIEIRSVGKGKSKTPNRFKVNFNEFLKWEEHSIDDCYKHPDFQIETDNYKAKGWQPSYLNELNDILPTSSPTPQQSEDYIENINNKENKLSEGSKQVEMKSNQFEVYKKREDELLDKLYNTKTWTDFKTFRKQINELISNATTEKIAEKTKKRFTSIAEGKIKFLKNKISKEPYNSFYDDFYRECDCGRKGKGMEDKKQTIIQPQQVEKDDNAFLREMYKQSGWDIPDSLKPKKSQQEGKDFHPFDDMDNLPF